MFHQFMSKKYVDSKQTIVKKDRKVEKVEKQILHEKTGFTFEKTGFNKKKQDLFCLLKLKNVEILFFKQFLFFCFFGKKEKKKTGFRPTRAFQLRGHGHPRGDPTPNFFPDFKSSILRLSNEV